MTKRRHQTIPFDRSKPVAKAQAQTVESLYDAIVDGNEYGSIVSLLPNPKLDLMSELVRGVHDIEKLRGRPCLCYVGNVVRPDDGSSGIDSTDDLSFAELTSAVPSSEKKVDVLLATRGGSGHQVTRFVHFLRNRSEEVDFLIPSLCMSAGTLFALSGNNIWMTERACLGPIDPQVPTKDGRYVPAQALLLLLSQLELTGQEARKNGNNIPWTAVRIVDGIDKKELGDAISATDYSTMMAARFLIDYKFKNWNVRAGSGQQVTDAYRQERAMTIAKELASHEKWKNHGHAISRDVLWNEIRLKIEHPDETLERVLLRFWALLTWVFDKTTMLKIMVSSNYRFARFALTQQANV